ncbi:putative mitochondrial carrier protein [Echria macrotheca]|uniref:Mitochondrial carrier protein n=1 Tax=Echria macrotheca TaxID=438768 RepID=A0AAJ0B8A5_9PEZI|nr:putative mitochondrial carrier protein [Echria macrotheca]
MSADFWAGYISGAVGIIIGNPLDVLKVKLQAGLSSSSPPSSPSPSPSPPTPTTPAIKTKLITPSSFLTGTAAPVLGYGALNALLFVSYNRTESTLNNLLSSPSGTGTGSNLWTTWLAGAVGGLATWVVSTPTELVKCRVQLSSSSSSSSSWSTTTQILRDNGVRGLYHGGGITALRDSVGYGFYFWGYELARRCYSSFSGGDGNKAGSGSSTAEILLCGGIAGIVTWASIFPLDVIKTRVQTRDLVLGSVAAAQGGTEREGLLPPPTTRKQKMGGGGGAWEVARMTWAEGGIRPFFKGLGVCSLRAFVVNAVQWAVYEWIMMELGQGRKDGKPVAGTGAGTGTGEMVGLG